MPQPLVLVESKAKADTFARLLGPGYAVTPVPANLRDFPARALGVGPAPDFVPQLDVPAERRPQARALVAAASAASAVYLAQDPGSDGEYAAWNAAEVLAAAGVPTPVLRVRCPKLAPAPLRAAFAAAGPLDMALVHAHLARRVIDRLVAYRTGPFLWKGVQPGLPASRLQTAVLRAVRAAAQSAPAPDEFALWEVGAIARRRGNPTPIVLRLAAINGKPADLRGETRASEARALLERCSLVVSRTSQHTSLSLPEPAFTTATLLQHASALFGLTPARTLAAAQRLHEGVDLGEGPVSLITFPFTDSSAVPYDEAVATRAYARSRFGAKYSLVGRIARGELSAGGVGAIRPTDLTRDPETLRDRLDPLLYRLYALVWRRFVASQMASVRVNTAIALVNATGAPKAFRLRAEAPSVVFRGHRVISDTIAPPGSAAETPLPPLAELAPGEELELVEWTCRRTDAAPEAPRPEADLVAELASRGISHPPALVAAVNALGRLGCLERNGGSLVATDLGVRLSDFLGGAFPALFSDEAALRDEARLASVAAGEADWLDVVREAHSTLASSIEEALAPPRADPEKVDAVLFALESVVNWESSPREGQAQTDEAFFEQIRDEFARSRDGEGDGVSERTFDRLLQVLGHYRAQIPNFVDLVRRLGRYDLLELPDNAPDAKTIRTKMEWVDKAPLSPESKRFVESLKHQADGGRHLTGAQVRVLDEILAAQALRIPGLTSEILAELGITPRTQADIDHIQRLLDTLSSIKQWRPPSKRGKRTYDDQSFTASVREQFERRGDLSPAQLNAVKRMVARYHAQIDNYAEIASQYDLPPEGLEQPTPGRRRRKPAPAPAPAADAPQPPAPPPATAPNPVEDL